jgi:hypothetical protein
LRAFLRNIDSGGGTPLASGCNPNDGRATTDAAPAPADDDDVNAATPKIIAVDAAHNTPATLRRPHPRTRDSRRSVCVDANGKSISRSSVPAARRPDVDVADVPGSTLNTIASTRSDVSNESPTSHPDGSSLRKQPGDRNPRFVAPRFVDDASRTAGAARACDVI